VSEQGGKKPARGRLAAAQAAAAAVGVKSEVAPGTAAHKPAAPTEAAPPSAAPSESAPAAAEAPASAPAAPGVRKPARGKLAAAKAAAQKVGVRSEPTGTEKTQPGGGHAPAAAPAAAAPVASAPAAAAPAAAASAPAAAKAKVEAKPAAPAAPLPKLTPKSAPKAAAKGGTRRDFNVALAVGWGSFAAASGVFINACIRFLYPNLLPEKPLKFKAGKPDDLPVGVNGQFKETEGVWLIRTNDEIVALSVICTHLGCIPNWLESDQKFKCPCHGSGFYKSGVNFEGPAPRPMERFSISLADDGQMLVDKSQKFQSELGQWDPQKYPESSLRLS